MFFLAGVPLVMLYHRHPRVGIATVLTILAGTSCYLLFWIGFDEPYSQSIVALHPGFPKLYSAPWNRSPVYIVGLLFGFAWHSKTRGRARGISSCTEVSSVGSFDGSSDNGSDPKHQQKGATWNQSAASGVVFFKRSVSVKDTVVPAVASALFMALPIVGTYWAYQGTDEARFPEWAEALHIAFSRPMWGLGVALMCWLCFAGRGGPVNWLLSRPVWVVPARLTYCAYLVHPLLLIWLFASRQHPVKITLLEFSTTCAWCATSGFTAALILYLAVEAPFRNLESVALGRRKARGGLRGSTDNESVAEKMKTR